MANSKWKFLRIRIFLLLISSLFAGWQGFSIKNLDAAVGESTSISMFDILFFLIATPIAVLVVIGAQTKNRYSDTFWDKPSWFNNPFNPKQPIQFFHMAAWLFLISGVNLILGSLIGFGKISYHGIFVSLVGCGAWLGVKASQLLFKSKFNK